MQGFSVAGRRPRRLIGLLVVGVLVAASCGDDDDDGGGAADTGGATTAAPAGTTAPADTGAATTAPAGDTTTAPSDTGAATTAPAGDTTTAPGGEVEGKVTDFAAYVGGSGAADTSLPPVKIGYINQQGGSIVVTDTNDDGVDIGVTYINENAGGIGGRPLEVVQCFIADTEEEGQQCGQQFANDDEIVAVISGPTVTGTESFYAALAGAKPVIHGVSVNPADTQQETAAVLYGGAEYILAPYATFAQDKLGVTSAALVYPEGAGQDNAAAGQASAFEALDIPIEVVSYPPNTPDLTVPLLAADAQNVDLVMPVISTNDCVKFAEAQRQLNIPDEKVLASPVCITPATIEGLGDFPEWIYAVASSLSIDPTDPSVPPYTDILTEQGQEAFIGDPWVLVGFGQVLTAAKFMNALGEDVTPDGIVEQMKSFEGPLILGSPVLDCGKYPEAPGVCNDHTQFYKYNGPDGWEQAGDYYAPPEGWVAPG
jgi:branched-chain amino acid transport system substrate-binding protein